jgi:hypothetical protein
MDNPLLESYKQIVAVRNTEQTTHWTRYNIQITLNSAVLFGFMVTTSAGDVDSSLAPVAISFGAVLTAVWMWITRNGHRWIRIWNEQLADIEREADLPRVFSHALDQTTFNMFHLGAFASVIPVIFAVAWVFVAFSNASKTHGELWSCVAVAVVSSAGAVTVGQLGQVNWETSQKPRVSAPLFRNAETDKERS